MAANVGRPRKLLSQKDYKTFEKLAASMCSQKEIADILGMDVKTMIKAVETYTKKDFSTVYKKAQSIGNVKLRSTMYKMASKNVAMAIFLAKNYLGLKDSNQTNEQNIPKVRFEIHE